MTLLKSLAVVSLAPVILAGCASTAKNIDHDLDLVLEPALVSNLKAHAPPTAPKAELVKLDTLTESEHRFNFGKLSTVDEKKTFKWMPNGELSYILKLSHTAADNSKTALLASSTSICGLEPILSESFSDDNSQFTTAVPAGGVFLPITFNSPRRFSGRYRLRSFEASVANVCAPTPGSKFSYKLTAENQRRIEGTFSFNKLFEIIQGVTCSTGTEEKPASTIDPSLRGNYLELNCVHVEPGKAPTTAVLAFLLDSGMYLPLKQEVNEYQKNSLRRVSAGYR